MKKLFKSLRQKLGLLAIIVSAMVLGGMTTTLVRAAIPDSNGTIHACYNSSSSGELRVIDSPSQSCNTGETGINWNQGPAGTLAYDGSTSELTLTEGDSATASNRANLGGPSVTVNVPDVAGTMVRFYGSGDTKYDCSDYMYMYGHITDETTGQDVGNDILNPWLAGAGTTDYETTEVVPFYITPSAGSHTYDYRFEASGTSDTSCTAYFKNLKLWAEVVVPS